jgi:uncharacterized membrane protein YhhN
MKFQRYLIYLFWIFAVATLIVEWNNWHSALYFVKAPVLALLAFWFYLKTKHIASVFSHCMLAGFLLSLAGDVLLIEAKYGSETYFLLGLLSFLLAHLCYIVAFLKFPYIRRGLIGRNPMTVIPFLILLVLIVFYLWRDLPSNLRYPVVCYCAVIVTMASCSVNMHGRIEKGAFRMLFAGAMLFVISDFLIALGKFKNPDIPLHIMRVLIMSSYILAQYLLAAGSATIAKQAHEVLTRKG